MEIFFNNIIDSIRFHSVPVQMVETTKTPTDKNNNRNKFWNVVVFVSCLSMGMLACSLHSNANTRGYVSVSLMVLFVSIQLVMMRMFFTCQPLFMIIVCSLTIFIEFFPFPSPFCFLFRANMQYVRTYHFPFSHASSTFRCQKRRRRFHNHKQQFWIEQPRYIQIVSLSIDVYNWINVKHEKFILSLLHFSFDLHTQTL